MRICTLNRSAISRLLSNAAIATQLPWLAALRRAAIIRPKTRCCGDRATATLDAAFFERAKAAIVAAPPADIQTIKRALNATQLRVHRQDGRIEII